MQSGELESQAAAGLVHRFTDVMIVMITVMVVVMVMLIGVLIVIVMGCNDDAFCSDGYVQKFILAGRPRGRKVCLDTQ